MNDTMSLLLATGILAVGGLGLFMYKNSSEDKNISFSLNDDKNEDNWFDLRSFFGNSNENEEENSDENSDENIEEDDIEVYKTKSKSKGNKTKTTRKNGGTKRKY